MNKPTIQLVTIFLLFSLATGKIFADAEGSSESKTSISQDKEREMREWAIKSAEKDIALQANNSEFTCKGIGMIDNGIALDGSVIFFKTDTRKLICSYGMAWCLSADTKLCSNSCPPPEWKENGCWEKREEYLVKERLEAEELKSNY